MIKDYRNIDLDENVLKRINSNNPYSQTMEEIIASRLSRNGVPKRYKNASIDDFEDKNIDDYAGAVMAIGSVGTGKTHLACAIINNCCRYGEAFYTRQMDMSKDIMQNKNEDFYKKVDFLFIDEIGRSFGTKGENDRFFDVVNYRYDSLLPTGFASNLQPKELKECMGAAIVDRIKQDCKVLKMTGESKR